MKEIICYTAGTAKANPGAAAVGVSIPLLGIEIAQSIGNATDEYASYQAVMVALEAVLESIGEKTKETSVIVMLDNQQVANQLNATAPVTHPGLVPYYIAIHNLCVLHFPQTNFVYIDTADNQIAVKLSMNALDGSL